MATSTSPITGNSDDYGESTLARGDTLAEGLAGGAKKTHSASQHITWSILTGKVKLVERDFRHAMSSFLGYEQDASATLQRLAGSPKLLTPDSTIFSETLIARLTAQRDTNRALFQTFSSAVSNLRQSAASLTSNSVNVAILMLTFASIWLALASYRTATTTLNDARASAKQQEESTTRQIAALDAARKATDVASAATLSQQALLSKMADSTGKQVDLLATAQARELEEADLTAVICYPASPSILLVNNGPHRVASNVFYEVRLRNLTAAQDGKLGLLGTAAPKIDYILPHRADGPESLVFYPSIVSRQPKEGDRLFGYATVMCPVCKKAQVYWMYIEYGKEGVYAQGTDNEFPFFNLDESNATATVNRFLRKTNLIGMPTKFQ